MAFESLFAERGHTGLGDVTTLALFHRRPLTRFSRGLLLRADREACRVDDANSAAARSFEMPCRRAIDDATRLKPGCFMTLSSAPALPPTALTLASVYRGIPHALGLSR